VNDKKVIKLEAQLETAKAALNEAINKSEWQARTNRELNDLTAEIYRLKNAMQQTIDENLNLADGEDCTLRHLKRALAA